MQSVAAPHRTATDTLIERLRTDVFTRKPYLATIIEKFGTKNLLQYVHGYGEVDISPLMLSRQDEFLNTFEKEVAETLTPDAARRARAQLKRTFFASTNDHQGPMNAFDMFNAHVILALAAMATEDKTEMDAVIVFSCCNVSLNNVTFPRGLLFHVDTPDGIAPRRLSLLPSNSHACSLYGYRAYEQREIEKLQKLLRQNVREGQIPAHVADKLHHIVTDIFGDPAILKRKTYSAQSSIINRRLWELVFQGRSEAPIMINIGQERLVARLLLDHHLTRDTTIRRLLFDPSYERLVVKHFDGIYGAFTRADNQGTYMFWGRSPDGLRLKMRKEGTMLVSEDATLRIEWTPEAVAEALRRKTIIPSILLVFSVLSFYYGLKCLGGYSQVNYLTLMKEAYMAMMRELGDDASADACMPVSTKNWSGFTFTFLRDRRNVLTPAQFLDLHLYSDPGMWDRLMDYAHVCTLREAAEPLLPEMYRYSFGESERRQELMDITPEYIATKGRLMPCVHMS